MEVALSCPDGLHLRGTFRFPCASSFTITPHFAFRCNGAERSDAVASVRVLIRCDGSARRAERQRDGAHVLVGVQEVGALEERLLSRSGSGQCCKLVRCNTPWQLTCVFLAIDFAAMQELPERVRVARPGGGRLHPPGGRPGVRAQGHRAPAPGAARRGGRVLLVLRRLAGDAHHVVLRQVGGAPDDYEGRVRRGCPWRVRGGVHGRGARRGRRDADRGRRPPEARPGPRRAGGAEQGGDVAADGVDEPRGAGQGGRARRAGGRRQRKRPGQGVLRADAAHLVRVRIRAGRARLPGDAARAPPPPPTPAAGRGGTVVPPRQARGGGQGVLQREHRGDRDEALAGRRCDVPGRPGRSPAVGVVQRGKVKEQNNPSLSQSLTRAAGAGN
jgi:hypothetical protein